MMNKKKKNIITAIVLVLFMIFLCTACSSITTKNDFEISDNMSIKEFKLKLMLSKMVLFLKDNEIFSSLIIGFVSLNDFIRNFLIIAIIFFYNFSKFIFVYFYFMTKNICFLINFF